MPPLHNVARWTSAAFLEDPAVSFSVDRKDLLLAFLPYILILKMEDTCPSETLVQVYRSTWLHIPENSAMTCRPIAK
jgi:hypothetical protein